MINTRHIREDLIKSQVRVIAQWFCNFHKFLIQPLIVSLGWILHHSKNFINIDRRLIQLELHCKSTYALHLLDKVLQRHLPFLERLIFVVGTVEFLENFNISYTRKHHLEFPLIKNAGFVRVIVKEKLLETLKLVSKKI